MAMTDICPMCGAPLCETLRNTYLVRYKCTRCRTLLMVTAALPIAPIGANYERVHNALEDVINRIAPEGEIAQCPD